MALINYLINYWIAAPWPIALAIAFTANTTAYLVSAWCINNLLKILIQRNIAYYIDQRPLKEHQIKTEARWGALACALFALLSLLTREVFDTVWPRSWLVLGFQLVAFVVFYETYSYFIHRALHTPLLRSFHGVHHRSVRTTPWSAYSVHPLEAFCIGITAPLFMFLFPMSLGLAFILHFAGMAFTVLLHSNFAFRMNHSLGQRLAGPSQFHATHHHQGSTNFGFIHAFWDKCCKSYGQSYNQN